MPVLARMLCSEGLVRVSPHDTSEPGSVVSGSVALGLLGPSFWIRIRSVHSVA